MAAPTSTASSGFARRRPTELQPSTTTIRNSQIRDDQRLRFIDRVPVLYYLSRNGQLEHPHFMEVPLSSPHHGLFLSDVIERLNVLRGKGMASMYSWSCKRSYKNGFVWHDLSENDFIYPAHGHHEYVLKGSLLPDNAFLDTVVSSHSQPLHLPENRNLDSPRPPERRRRNQSCSSIDFNPCEYSVYKAESSAVRISAATDAATQTDDSRRRRRRPAPEIVEVKEEKGKEPCNMEKDPQRDEMEIVLEISPPPSDSSPETLEKLMKADGRLILRPETIAEDEREDGRWKGGKGSVLMQLISCGSSLSFKDCGAGQGLGLISQQHKTTRMPRGGGVMKAVKKTEEEKEYFSGSLVEEEETKKNEFLKLRRSTSCTADR